MTATTATYTRGTKTTKVTTAKIANAPGTWVLTVDATDEHKARLAARDYATDAAVTNTETKTGTTLRQVERAEAVMHAANGYYRRAQRTYTIHFTDGSYAYGNAPANTWMTVEAPAAPAAEVAPLEVVTLDGEELTVEVTATEVATKAYRIGKLLRTWVLARGADSYDAALVAHITAANECYDGTATLRLTAAWSEVLINAAADMDREHKAAARAARRTLYALFA